MCKYYIGYIVNKLKQWIFNKNRINWEQKLILSEMIGVRLLNSSLDNTIIWIFTWIRLRAG